MKNIQAQYQDLLEGKMSKANFMRNIRMQFPQHISSVTSYDDSVKILKGKRILSESSIEELSPATRRAAYDKAIFTGSNTDREKDYLGFTKRIRQAAKFGYEMDPAMKKKLNSLFAGTEYSIDFRKSPDEITVLLFKGDNKVAEVIVKKDEHKIKQLDAIKDEAIVNKLHTAIKHLQKSGELGEALNEDKKPIGVYGHNPNAETDLYRGIDHVNYYQMYHGLQYELAKMPEINDANYIKARKKVVDAILKDPDAYKDLQLANFKAVKDMDKDLEMKDVKKDNLVDKPNEMKVVKKDAKGNTQDTLENKEKKKSKTAKVPVMTQSPKGNLEAFATPGKEKVIALKEHILDELTKPNEVREDINKGSRVKKKGLEGYDAAQVGNVIEFDGDTATVQWDNDKIEHVQGNVLTKKDIPQHPKAREKFAQIPDSPFVKKEEESKESKLKGLKEKIMKTVKELLYRDTKTQRVQSFQPNDPAVKDPDFNRVFKRV